MRIAYVTETYPPEINGVALTAERAVRHLRAARHEVLLVRPRRPGERALDGRDEWRSRGGPIPMYPELRFGWASVAALRERWRARALDLVHVATPGPLAWAALKAARAEGIATSADFRTNFHAYSRHYRLGWLAPLVLGHLRRLHAMADCSFVPTQALATELAQHGFERLRVVGRGVDAQRFSPAWRDPWLRGRWHAQGDDPVLLYVGRLAPEKNVGLALDTFERLRADVPRLRMVVVGDGPQRGALAAAHPKVTFAGVQRGTDLSSCFASADVFLFPSLTETFGNVTLEALASGLPVVAYDTAAAALHVAHGRSGWLVPKDSGKEPFIAAARQALQHCDPHGPVRQAARQAALAADWDSVLRAFEESLRGLPAMPTERVADAALA